MSYSLNEPILIPAFQNIIGIFFGIAIPRLLKLHKFLNLPKIKRVHNYDSAFIGILLIESFFSYIIFIILVNTGTSLNLVSSIAIGMGCVPYIEKWVNNNMEGQNIPKPKID